MISIVVPTMRVGGLDIITDGLSKQTSLDFELIISDGLYKYRQEIVNAKVRSLPFGVTHTEPRGNPFPVASFCRYSNEALVQAKGDHILFITDYTWLPPNTIETHIDFHKSVENDSGLMCPHEYYSLPPTKQSFRPYQWDEIERYKSDLDNGSLNDCMWSLFDDDFEINKLNKGGEYHQKDGMKGWGTDPKVSLPNGPIDPMMFHGKNESVPTERVISINGWDEDLDGGHGYQDSELSGRLATNGLKWSLINAPVAKLINPRPIFPRPHMNRSIQSNEAIWRTKESSGYPIPNSWSISEARKASDR